MDRNLVATPAVLVTTVALRKESVDRNDAVGIAVHAIFGRSPQGERG